VSPQEGKELKHFAYKETNLMKSCLYWILNDSTHWHYPSPTQFGHRRNGQCSKIEEKTEIRLLKCSKYAASSIIHAHRRPAEARIEGHKNIFTRKKKISSSKMVCFTWSREIIDGHLLARKIMRLEYFWVSKETDYIKHVCYHHCCQVYGDKINALPNKLHLMS